MNYRISELMDGYNDDEIDLEDKKVVSTEKIMELTMGRLPGQVTPIRRGRKLWRTILVAAVCVLALTATALAVYQYTIKDTVMENLPSLAYRNQTESVTEMSLVGFSDSPEYQAYVEWETWYRTWEAENHNWFNEQGVDDAWHETPDNYLYYGAYNQEQADKLDEITEKYGLALHTDWQWGQKQTQLCEALDMDTIFGDELTLAEFDIYEDGSFQADCTTDITGEKVWVSTTVSVNGAFTDIGMVKMPDSYEEWSYTTADGREVLLASADEYSWMVADLEGCFVHVGFGSITDKNQIETLVENIDLEGIDTRFATESARRQAVQAVSNWVAQRQTDVVTDNTSDEGVLAQKILGNYVITGLPEGSYLWKTEGNLPESVQAQNDVFGAENTDSYYSVSNAYEVTDCGEVTLFYRTLKDGETTLIVGDQESAELGYVVAADTIQGYPTLVVDRNAGNDKPKYEIRWLDTDRELMFRLTCSGWPSLEEMMAWAQSVTAVDPDLAVGAAAYESRAAQYRDDIEALMAASAAELEANAAEGEAELARRVELLGDYSITADTVEVDVAYINDEMDCWDRVTGLVLGRTIDFLKEYRMVETGRYGLQLYYQRFWDEEGNSLAQRMYEDGYQNRLDNLDEATEKVAVCQVNGMDAYVVTRDMSQLPGAVADMGADISWLGTENDLVFHIYGYYKDGVTAEEAASEIITLTESVQ